MDEALILEGLKVRDMKAFNMLYDSLFSIVRYYTEQITRDELEAEDIAIHSFAKFWEQDLSKFDTMKKVRNFIFNIAKNSAIDFLRKKKVQHSHQHNIVYLSKEEEDYYLERSNYEKELLTNLYREIDKLAPRTREVFNMVYLENISRNDVASQLNISVNTVHRLCSEAMQKLRNKFSERELLLLLLICTLCEN